MRANPEIETRISEIQGVMAMRSQATADRVIAELARIGFADITEMVSIERGRLKMKDTKDISPDLRAAIQEIQKGKTGIKVKLHDKIAALQHIGKHLGLFKENVDLNVNISLADLVNGSYQLASDGQVVDVTPAAADEPSGDT
jgi:phage terminase small subunit